MKKITLILALLSFLGMQVIMAQTTVTGTVTDDSGAPIPGATIIPQSNPQYGTLSESDGSYKVEVPAGETHLKISFLGKQDQVVEIAGRSKIDVTLKNEDINVEEVIITGYAIKGKNSLTGSTIQLNGDDIRNSPVATVDQTLQGKVPGLTISASSGTPGSIQDIRIRGVGSINAGNDPLIVIDGVPVINTDMGDSENTGRSSLSALASINSADIESITVLKDASATSAYGARGSNGVIVITTKKGKNAKTTFNLSTSYGFQNKATAGREVLTGVQREELYLEAVYNQYGTAYDFTEAEAYDFVVANDLNPTLVNWVDADRPINDWDAAMRNENAPVFNMNFSASGGNETSSFYSSLGYNKTESVVLGSQFSRINGSLNYNRVLSDRVKFSTSNTVSHTNQDGAILEQSAYFANPIMSKYFTSPWYAPYDEAGEPTFDIGGPYNYLYLKDHDISYNKLTRMMNNSFLEVEIIDNLKFKTLVAMDFNIADYKNHSNRVYGDASAEGGSTYTSLGRNINIVTQNSLSYVMQKDEHFVSALALIEYQKNQYYFLDAYGESFIADGLTNVNSAGANKDADSYYEDWMNASYLGMVNYEYADKYVVDATFRREGSSRFAAGHRFGNFWSVGAAWNIIKEDFMANLDFVSNLRLRGSYGLSGNSAINLNSYQALLGFDADYAGAGAIYPSTYGNSFLTWEKNRNYDLGFDFGFLSEKITGSFAYFNKYTFDLLQAVPLSRTSGHASYTSNIGEVVNKGIEALVDIAIVRSQDLNVSLSLNFATLDNEVVELAKDGEGNYINIETGTRKVEVGHPIYEWRMKKYAGVNPENGNPQWYLNGKDGEVTETYASAALEFQGGSAIPTYSGGAGIHADYKGVYFDMNLYLAGGHKVYEDWSFYTHHAGRYTIEYYQGVSDLMNRWQEVGDVTDVPKMYYNNTGNNASSTSTRFLYDGTYARVKDIVIGYNLPSEWLAFAKFQSASIYLRGTNLFTWVKDENLQYDPEVRADGFTRLTNPPIKSVSFGLNLNF